MSKQHKIYISSTFMDLKEHRDAVYRSLRALGHDVISMEDYVASHQRPTRKCLDDVERCDVYIGIFAWRYGYIPKEGAESKSSITRLEYETAVEKKKHVLVFLLGEDAAWTPNFMDLYNRQGENGVLINSLRAKLMEENLVGWFTDKTDLVIQVLKSIYVLDNTPDQKLSYQKEIEEWERTGLAQDMHDLINWYHSGVIMWIEAIDVWMQRNEQKRVAELMPQLRRHAYTTVYELKTLHTNLLSKAFEAHTFKDALAKTLSAWLNRATPKHKNQMDITIECPEDLEVPVRLRNTIIRIALIAFSNAIRHSGIIEDPSIKVTVQLNHDEKGIVLAVIDNGRGIDADKTLPGFGLDRMRQLTQMINIWGEMSSSLDIITGVNQGTQVVLNLQAKDESRMHRAGSER